MFKKLPFFAKIMLFSCLKCLPAYDMQGFVYLLIRNLGGCPTRAVLR